MTQWRPGAGIPKGVQAGEHGVVISNLPYGVRIGDERSIKRIYSHFADLMTECPEWSFFLITSDKEIEKDIMKRTRRKADRRRKLYNGTIETQFYQYHGERPPKSKIE